MAEICPICEGQGLRIVERDGRQFAEECECRLRQQAARRLLRVRIPARYADCTLDNYEKVPGWNSSLAAALIHARKFVEGYPLVTKGKGLLFTGTVGIGKTHLAVGILKALTAKGVSCLFSDYRDLLKQVQNSYNPQVRETEREVLQPVFDAEVLVLDELGAAKPSEWVGDMVAHILNTRYNNRQTTIITTNFENQKPLNSEEEMRRSIHEDTWTIRKDTLGDRIGERMRSRLQEMCVVVKMKGEDSRQMFKRATFSQSKDNDGAEPPAAETST